MESIGSLKTTKLAVPKDLSSASGGHQGAGSFLEAGKRAEKGLPKQAEKVDARDVKAMALELDKALKDIDSNFSVSIDDITGILVVRITDPTTGEIVKQVPPQQLLDADVNMDKIIGLLVDDMA